MPKTNYAKYMIMGLLGGSPMTGYDIKKWADECLKYLLMDMSYGQIYPILSRLEQDGLATVTISARRVKGRAARPTGSPARVWRRSGPGSGAPTRKSTTFS